MVKVLVSYSRIVIDRIGAVSKFVPSASTADWICRAAKGTLPVESIIYDNVKRVIGSRKGNRGLEDLPGAY